MPPTPTTPPPPAALVMPPATAATSSSVNSRSISDGSASLGAASDGGVVRGTRRVEPCTIEILEAADAPALLVIHLNGIDRLSMIEIARGEERLRLALPAPTAGTIVLSLDPANAEAAMLYRLVRDLASEIFLL